MSEHSAPRVLAAAGIDRLMDGLRRWGYEVVGPTLRNEGIRLGELRSSNDLPRACADEQQPAHYRVRPRADGALFAHAAPVDAWKRYFLPPATRFLTVVREADGTLRFVAEAVAERRLALFGIRPCDLRALAILDRVLMGDFVTDSAYAARRRGVAVVAVNCVTPAASCFCAAMETGPWVKGAGYDLCLTELLSPVHRFLVETGSGLGEELAEESGATVAGAADVAQAERLLANAAASQVRAVGLAGLRDRLYGAVESPHWNEVEKRCLACTNCTMQCPTCFCTTMEDTSDLEGRTAERWRYWDSCFSQQYSYIHGGSVRKSIASRYRQWLTHKFAAWQDQFGCVGCVGCGRCITWCPAGIDVTEEVRAAGETAVGGK
jgi:ferredoxin